MLAVAHVSFKRLHQLLRYHAGADINLLITALALRLLLGDATRPASGLVVGAVQGIVDVALAVRSDEERGRVDQLTTNADVALEDEGAGVVHALGDVQLEDLQGGGREGGDQRAVSARSTNTLTSDLHCTQQFSLKLK